MQNKRSSLWNETVDFVKSLIAMLFFIYATIELIDYSIKIIPELKTFSINHSKIIKNINVVIPYLFGKVKKGSKLNLKKVCACATIIAGILSMNHALIIWGLLSLIKSFNESYSEKNNYGCYRVNGRSFRYRL